MNTLSTTSLLTHALAWALLHSLWQGLAIYTVLFVLLKALPGISARIRYYLSLSAFVALFLWFADTWSTQYQHLKGVTVYISYAGADNATVTTRPVQTAVSGGSANSNLMHHLQPQLEHYLPYIMLIYFIGLAFMLFRFLISYLQVRALKTKGTVQPGREWSELLLKWKEQLGISRPVKLLLSARVDVPMMIGAIKPVILLPIATFNSLTTEEVEAILMHELAHIRRYDYLLNILQVAVETLLFFNPFIWLISAAIRREREFCCDDMVVETSASPLSYARALAILAENQFKDNSLALAATGPRNQLFHRIKRIMEMKKKNLNYGQAAAIFLAIVLVALIAVMCTFTPSLAQKAKKDKADTTAHTKTVYKYRTVVIDDKGNKTVHEETSDKPLRDDDIPAPPTPPVPPSGASAPTPPAPPTPPGNSSSFSYSFSTDSPDMQRMINDVKLFTEDVTKRFGGSLDKVEEALANVDWKEINEEIQNGMDEMKKELTDPNVRKEVKEEIHKGMEEGKRAMEEARVEMAKAREDMADAHREMRSAKVIVDHGNGHTGYDSPDYEKMLDKMEDDGLIDRSHDFKIKKANEELYINGTLQPDEVYQKYHRYLQAKNITIKGKKGYLSINVND